VAVSPKQNAVLLHFVRQFKACTLPFISRFYLKLHCICELSSLRIMIAPWNFQRSCWHGMMKVHTT